MVDFMYYGEVNVSQDQLPSIIKTAESLKIKGLADMHTAQLTKWPSGSSEPSEVNCGESCSPSPSPVSPSFRRKRLRKTSTGSTSGSGEKPDDANEITLVAMNVVKPEPTIVNQASAANNRRPANASNESQGSIEEDQISIMSNMESNSAPTPAQSNNSMQNVNQQPATNVAQTPGTTGHNPAHQGLQWTIMEHTYPRFALSSCQTNLSVQASSAFTTPDLSTTQNITDTYGGTNTPGPSCALTNYGNSPHGQLSSSSSQHNNNNSGPSPSPSSSSSTTGNQCNTNCQSPCASPQQPGPQKRKRSTNPQADENFIRALDAVRYGGIGFCKAARMYGVNNRTLWLEYKKRGYPNNRPSVKTRVKHENNSSSPPSNTQQGQQQQQTTNNPPSPTTMGPPTTTPHSTHNQHSSPTMITPHSPHSTMLTTHSSHSMLGNYVDTRHTDYSLPNSAMPINLHGVNYNSM